MVDPLEKKGETDRVAGAEGGKELPVDGIGICPGARS